MEPVDGGVEVRNVEFRLVTQTPSPTLTIGATIARGPATTPSTPECRPNRRLPRSIRSGLKEELFVMDRILGRAADIAIGAGTADQQF